MGLPALRRLRTGWMPGEIVACLLALCPVASLLQEEESLAHQIKCFEGTPQASQIKLVADKVRGGRDCEGERSTRAGEHRTPGGSAGKLVGDA